MFIMASNPPDILRGQAYKLLIVTPVVEGLSGGWSTVQGAANASVVEVMPLFQWSCLTGLIQIYIRLHVSWLPVSFLGISRTTCLPALSSTHIFSRFTGVLYVGFALGPVIAALILQSTHMTTLVFYTSAICTSINIFLLLFVVPESLNTEMRMRNVEAAHEARIKLRQGVAGKWGPWNSIRSAVNAFVEPLGMLGPKPRLHGRGQDWSVTIMSAALVGFFLSVVSSTISMIQWRLLNSGVLLFSGLAPNQISLC